MAHARRQAPSARRRRSAGSGRTHAERAATGRRQPGARARRGAALTRAAAPAQPAPRRRRTQQVRRCRSAPMRPPQRLRAGRQRRPGPQPRSMRTASVAPTQIAPAAPATAILARHGSGYAVQVSSQRSEAEAQAAFRSLQAKYPRPARRPAAADPQGRSGRQGNLFPRHGRPLRQRQRGERAVQQPQGCRRQCIIQRN